MDGYSETASMRSRRVSIPLVNKKNVVALEEDISKAGDYRMLSSRTAYRYMF